MTSYRSSVAAAAVALLAAAPAVACPMHIQPKLTDARRADAVVVGYVTKDVREATPERKARIQKWIAEHPGASREERRNLRMFDRARLTVEIDHAIAGQAPSTITVFWYRMTNNGPPESISGGYVFALRKLPPSPSDYDSDAYAVMQGLCSGALVFRRGSPQANAIREMFGLWPEPLEAPPVAPMVRPSAWPTLVVGGLLVAGAALVALLALRRGRRRRHGRP